MRRTVFRKRHATSPITRRLSFPWPCWSRPSLPDAFRWWSALFRLWISTPRLSSKHVFHCVEWLPLVSWWSTHPASSLSTRKVVAIKLSDFNSYSRCWGHVLLEVIFADLVQVFLSVVGILFSSSFSYSSSSLNNNIALIPLVVDGALDVCGSVCVGGWGFVNYVYNKTTQRIWQRKMKRRLSCSSNGSSRYYVHEVTHYSVRLELIH